MKQTAARDRALIAQVVKKAGGMRALGRVLGIAYQNVQHWRRIPAHHIVAIEEATGIPRETLRPELYVRKWQPPTTRKGKQLHDDL